MTSKDVYEVALVALDGLERVGVLARDAAAIAFMGLAFAVLSEQAVPASCVDTALQAEGVGTIPAALCGILWPEMMIVYAVGAGIGGVVVRVLWGWVQ